MKEYAIECEKVDIKTLETELMNSVDYKKAHQRLVISCHDIFIEYQKGILLVKRLNYPAQDIHWPLGGRIMRGMSTEDSLRKKVREESGLELSNLTKLGTVRTFFKTDPFNHGKGTDSLNIVYFAKGRGKLKLDKFHEKPLIISPKNYKLQKNKLHPYVRDHINKVMLLIKEG